MAWFSACVHACACELTLAILQCETAHLRQPILVSLPSLCLLQEAVCLLKIKQALYTTRKVGKGGKTDEAHVHTYVD